MPDLAARLIETEDGSLTLRDPGTGELFHNRAGALTEAVENYCKPSGAIELLKENGRLTVCDACFGLGYNTWALLTSLACEPDLSGAVKVIGLEISEEPLAFLPRVLQDPRLTPVQNIFTSPPAFGRLTGRLTGSVSLDFFLIRSDLRAALPAMTTDLDVVFHDPFSPRWVPELWTVDLFQHYYRLLEHLKGRLLTYSAAAAVRGGLLEAGFEVWRTPAVGGKSGGTLASVPGPGILPPCTIPLSDWERDKLLSGSGIPYRAPSLRESRGQVLQRREAEQKLHRLKQT